MKRLAWLLFLPLFLAPAGARAAAGFQPGFRTLGVWEGGSQLRLDVNVWHPAARAPKELSYPPWTISGALNARPAEGRFPLLVISHGSPADRFSHHALAAGLAREGFVVAAPTHARDNINNMDNLFSWRQLLQRVEDINAVIALLRADKELSPSIDFGSIGLVGFGSGAAAALLLGGAVPSCDAWPGYCAKAGRKDSYCSPWAVDRINSLCADLPLKRSLANPQIKAIAAVAPGFGMIFNADSFKYFHPPLLLAAAGRDDFNRPELHCGPIARHLGARARFLDLPLADAGALISPCPQQLADELPELCLSTPPKVKAEIQARLEEALLAFFSHYLLEPKNLPVIVEPPCLAPEAPEPELAQPAHKGPQGTQRR